MAFMLYPFETTKAGHSIAECNAQLFKDHDF